MNGICLKRDAKAQKGNPNQLFLIDVLSLSSPLIRTFGRRKKQWWRQGGAGGEGLQPPCRGGLAPLSGKITDLSGENEKTFEGRLTSTILLPN